MEASIAELNKIDLRMGQSQQSASDHFRAHGWVRIPAAFSAQEASAMCDVVWAGLAPSGIERDDPSTWTTPRLVHLQNLKGHSAFRVIGSARTIEAIKVMEDQTWARPADWGAFFLQFPIGGEWDIPSTGRHIDGDYAGE